QEKDSPAALESRPDVRNANPPIKGASAPAAAANEEKGRTLFSERGCLACHQHSATTADRTANGKKIPALASEATFGPDLSRVALKLGTLFGKPETARAWLVSWLQNPAGHSPRTLMPNVQLLPEDAIEIASWLLSRKAE